MKSYFFIKMSTKRNLVFLSREMKRGTTGCVFCDQITIQITGHTSHAPAFDRNRTSPYISSFAAVNCIISESRNATGFGFLSQRAEQSII